jgi:hypothetical protein
MHRGQSVTVSDAWGNKLNRKVVSASESTIFVCKPEDFDKALREGTEPNSIGTPVEDVIIAKK